MNNYILGRNNQHKNIFFVNNNWKINFTSFQKANFVDSFLLYIEHEQTVLTCGPWLFVTYSEYILQKEWVI